MWYALSFRSEVDAKIAAETLQNRKLVGEVHPVALPFTPETTFPAVVFPEEMREDVLSALALQDGPTTATSDPKLRLILGEPVTVLLPCGDLVDAVVQVLRIYASELGRGLSLVASNPHGKPCVPVEEDRVLHIRFYSSPRPSTQAQTFAKLFGKVLPAGVRDGLAPSGAGVPLAAPEGVVAEAHGNNLYILCDLPHPADEELTRTILAQILELFLEFQVRGESPGHRRGDDAEAYVQVCLRRQRLRLVELTGRREALARKMADAQQAIRDCLRGLEEVDLVLQGVGERQASELEAARQEYQTLLNLPHVERAETVGGYLHVHTNEIFLQQSGQTYLMGKYAIRIPLFDGSPLAIVNQAPKRSGTAVYHHPHVSGDGASMCLGNWAPGISQLIASRQWVLVTQSVLEFLHHVNAAGSGYIKFLQTHWTPLEKARPCSCQILSKSEGGVQQ
jgi:hypothetical protein